jgi:hypothetical protein
MPETTEEKIDAIDEILDGGVKSVTTDGQSVTFQDPEELRRRKRDLDQRRRPVVSSINLGGF